jgi:hypothetical protein
VDETAGGISSSSGTAICTYARGCMCKYVCAWCVHVIQHAR